MSVISEKEAAAPGCGIPAHGLASFVGRDGLDTFADGCEESLGWR